MKKFNVTAAMVMLPAAVGLMVLGGCSTSPPSSTGKQVLKNDSGTSIDNMEAMDSDLKGLLNQQVAYAVFPSVGKGAVGVGVASGRGIVYQNHKEIGFAKLTQASLGVQLGAETFSELIVFHTQEALENFQSNKLHFGATASAVALKAGAAKSVKFTDGIATFVHPNGGLMFDVSINGQQFTYQSKSSANSMNDNQNNDNQNNDNQNNGNQSNDNDNNGNNNNCN